MYRLALVWAAVGLYIAVAIGCVMSSSAGPDGPADNGAAPIKPNLAGLPYKGVAMQIQRVDWIDQYKKCIDEIVALGADSFLCIVDARQENGESTRIYLDFRMTPTQEKLGEIIDYAKEKKLRVLLMPIVLLDAPRGNEWRGTIKPSPDSGGWEAWFQSYRDMMTHYAIVAKQHKVDLLVVGSELVSAEKHADQWQQTIKHVRSIFDGQLTYSSNWDHYKDIPFWDQLDLIGMNSYWRLDEAYEDGKKVERREKVTVPEIVANWQEIQKPLADFSRKKGKPILFLEVGWCSLANAASEPWDYTKTEEPVDLDLQKRLWDGFFQAWYGKPYLAGFMVWAWAPNDGGPDDKGYTPKGKPAYDLIRQWMGKKWTE